MFFTKFRGNDFYNLFIIIKLSSCDTCILVNTTECVCTHTQTYIYIYIYMSKKYFNLTNETFKNMNDQKLEVTSLAPNMF